MPQSNPRIPVYVSYSWRVETDTRIVEFLTSACEERGSVRLIRDQTHLGYGDSILEFMGRLGAGRHIVAVVSRAFLESEYCMYEMLRVSREGELGGRLYPLVVKGFSLSRAEERMVWVKYWDQRAADFDREYKAFPGHHTEGQQRDLNRMMDIRNAISELLEFLAFHNNLVLDTGVDTDFTPVLERIERNEEIRIQNASVQHDAEEQRSEMPESADSQASQTPGLAGPEQEGTERRIDSSDPATPGVQPQRVGGGGGGEPGGVSDPSSKPDAPETPAPPPGSEPVTVRGLTRLFGVLAALLLAALPDCPWKVGESPEAFSPFPVQCPALAALGISPDLVAAIPGRSTLFPVLGCIVEAVAPPLGSARTGDGRGSKLSQLLEKVRGASDPVASALNELAEEKFPELPPGFQRKLLEFLAESSPQGWTPESKRRGRVTVWRILCGSMDVPLEEEVKRLARDVGNRLMCESCRENSEASGALTASCLMDRFRSTYCPGGGNQQEYPLCEKAGRGREHPLKEFQDLLQKATRDQKSEMSRQLSLDDIRDLVKAMDSKTDQRRFALWSLIFLGDHRVVRPALYLAQTTGSNDIRFAAIKSVESVIYELSDEDERSHAAYTLWTLLLDSDQDRRHANAIIKKVARKYCSDSRTYEFDLIKMRCAGNKGCKKKDGILEQLIELPEKVGGNAAMDRRIYLWVEKKVETQLSVAVGDAGSFSGGHWLSNGFYEAKDKGVGRKSIKIPPFCVSGVCFEIPLNVQVRQAAGGEDALEFESLEADVVAFRCVKN